MLLRLQTLLPLPRKTVVLMKLSRTGLLLFLWLQLLLLPMLPAQHSKLLKTGQLLPKPVTGLLSLLLKSLLLLL